MANNIHLMSPRQQNKRCVHCLGKSCLHGGKVTQVANVEHFNINGYVEITLNFKASTLNLKFVICLDLLHLKGNTVRRIFYIY